MAPISALVIFAVVGLLAAHASPDRFQSAPQAAEPAHCPGEDSVGLRLTYFDVGQGDATFVQSPEGRRLLIDGGRNRNHVASLLHARGVSALDLVIATHNHADHIGGLSSVLDAFPVANLLENGLPATTATYRALVRTASRRNVRVLAPTARTLTLGSMTVRVLSADPSARSQNPRSVGAIVTYGSFRAVFTGDAEPSTLDRWLATDTIARATVVLSGHHGAENGITTVWVQATSPSLVVISVGWSNSYGHPAQRTLEMWLAPGRRIVRTDLDGTVEVRGCQDGTFTMSTSAGDDR